MPEKRPHPPNGLENGDNKRSRSNQGSPAPAAGANDNAMGGMSEAERKRKDAEERIAKMKARMAGNKPQTAAIPPQPASSTGTKGPETMKREAAERIAALKAKYSGSPAQAIAPRSPAASSPAPSAAPVSDAAATAQARIEALKAKMAQRSNNRSPAMQGAPPPPPARTDDDLRARGGLGVGLHPALMQDNDPKAGTKDKSAGNKHGGQKARDNRFNPYLAQDSTEQESKDENTFDSGLQRQRDRKARAIVFNQKGKFIAEAESLRAQERLEQMRKAIEAEQHKQQIESRTERSFLVPAPPEIEWWDETLCADTLDPKAYSSLSSPPSSDQLVFPELINYVHHPVLFTAPQEAHQPGPKPLMLTKKEQAKLRRQRRMEDHKEEQAKIRLGLIPPPPPKVKKSNLMRVLGQEAVKDPTAVEARVNREIAARADEHVARNEDRKLSKEQRHEKLAAQQEADAGRGIRLAVFRVVTLSSGKHRYQVDINAKQNALTGIVVLHPRMNLIVVEGGVHSVNNYKKLMLNRVKWTENAPPVAGAEEDERNEKRSREWMKPIDERGFLKNLGENRCVLVWEGEAKERLFRRWGSRVAETDGEAKDFLGRSKMENMWTLAQSME